MDNYKKIVKIILKFLTIFIIAVLATLITEHYLFPRLSAMEFFSKYKILQKVAENVTIINKTEQVTIKEEDSISAIAEKASPAVVGIVSAAEKAPSGKSAPASKNGTGVIVASDGLIATYRSAIIENNARYRVFISDGSEHNAELFGVDEFSNLAYLKISASNLTAVSFANSADFRTGKKLVAIGNSGAEYQNQFASGLLSDINKTFNTAGKTLSFSEKLEGVFETDFIADESFLGGPVITYNGELAGITGTEIIDNQKNFFVIHSNAIRKSMELAIKNELALRPALGIYYIPITKKYAFVNNLEHDRGALIYSASGNQGLAIISNSPAEKAGLKINDIIIAVNNQEVNLDNPLSNLLSQYKKGDTVELLVARSGEEIKIKVELIMDWQI